MRPPLVGVLEQDTSMDFERPRTESKDSSNASSAYIVEHDADAQPERSNFEPDFKQTANFRTWETSKFRTEKLRSWEQKMRKQELQQQSPKPEDLERNYRDWEAKLRKGELDPLLQKSKKTWLLDKVAEIPETLHLSNSRTFWEVKSADT